MCDCGKSDDEVRAALSRRSFLHRGGLVGAGALAASAAGAFGAGSASATPVATGGARHRSRWRPDTTSNRFSVVIMPDTQYMFDGTAIHPEPVDASLQWVLDNQREHNIVFLAHLGDLAQNGAENEEAAESAAFERLDRADAAYSVLAGNHDTGPAGGDDQRGPTPYLNYFGPHRFAHAATFKGATPDGYNRYHVFRAADREWLLFALDWRVSDGNVTWVNDVIKAHPTLPVIITTHELVNCDALGEPGYLSDYGQQLWDEMINGNDQVFLGLGGHYWPPGRLVKQNAVGHDVHLHLTNYQNRYYGGAAMIRLYHFDLDRGVIDVETRSPFLQAHDRGNVLALQEQTLSTDVDYFSLSVDFDARFAGFAPVAPRPGRPARKILVDGTVAYWRFDGGLDGSALGANTRVRDLSGHGNDLVVANRPGAQADALTWTSDHHPDQPAHGSLRLQGGAPTGDYLLTLPHAPINAATLPNGYTVEAFFFVPADFDSSANAFSAMLSRRGESSQAGKATVPGDGDPLEPVGTLSLSGDRELQWAVYPLTQDGSLTNWGFELPVGAWWHVAIVNDARHTTLWVDGCENVRNPRMRNRGLATIGAPWLLGGYDYAGTLNQVYYGAIGDVRIVDRALRPAEFMIS